MSHVDTTAIQALMDTRKEIERWTDAPVTFHFCHILSPWIRRALVAGGFGIALTEKERLRIPFEIAPIVGSTALAQKKDKDGYVYTDLTQTKPVKDIEAGSGSADDIQQHSQIKGVNASAASSATDFEGSLVSTSTPYFHFDLSTAVLAAERDAARLGDRDRDSAVESSYPDDDDRKVPSPQ